MIQVIPLVFRTIGASSVEAGQIGHFDIMSTSEAFNLCSLPASGSFLHMTVKLENAPGSGKSHTFRLRAAIGGAAVADTDLVVTISDLDTTGSITVDVPLTAGDQVHIRHTPTGTPASGDAHVVLEWESTVASESIYSCRIAPSQTTEYVPVFCAGSTNGTSVDTSKQYLPTSGTITGMSAASNFSSTGAVNYYTFYIWLNGVKQDGTGGTVDTKLELKSVAVRVGVQNSFSLPVVRGDYVYITAEESGSFSNWVGFGVKFVADTDGESIITQHPRSLGDPGASTTPTYVLRPADVDKGYAATSASAVFERGLLCGRTRFTIGDWYMVVSADPGSGKQRLFKLTKDNVEQADGPAITIDGGSGGNIVGEDTTHVIDVSAGEYAGPITHVCASASTTVSGVEWQSFVMNSVFSWAGEGEIVEGAAATSGAIPTGAATLHFAVITVGGTTFAIGDTEGMSDASSYYSGNKVAEFTENGIGSILRELSKDGYRATSTTLTFTDVDYRWRTIAETQAVQGAYVALYAVDDAVRRAEGAPFKLFAGIIVEHEALDDVTYRITIEDKLGHKLSNINEDSRIPTHVLSITEWAGLDPSLDGAPGPLIFGHIEDAPMLYCGYLYLHQLNPAYDIAASVAIGHLDLWLISEGAVRDITAIYYNAPVWAPEEDVMVGDIVRPTPDEASGFIYKATVAGTTDASEPTWPGTGTVVDGTVTWEVYLADTPQTRFEVPTDAYGQLLTVPHDGQWPTATGLGTEYIDFYGRRYTAMFIKRSNRYAVALREGRITATANVYGLAENADGTGNYLDTPERIWAFLLINTVFGDSTWLTYADMPTLDGTVAVIDTDSIEAAKLISEARIGGAGYIAALIVGRDGSQQELFEALTELQIGADFESGVNRHGQLMVSREDIDAAATVEFDGNKDIIQFSVRPNRDDYANEVHYRSEYYHTESLAPIDTPRTGDPLPRYPHGTNRSTNNDNARWRTGIKKLSYAPAQAENASGGVGRKVRFTFDNYITQDGPTGADVALKTLYRSVGLPVGQDGWREFTLVTGWQGFGSGSNYVELGTVIEITDPRGLGAAGYSSVRGRVRSIQYDYNGKVTLKGRILTENVIESPDPPVTPPSLGSEVAEVVSGEAPFLNASYWIVPDHAPWPTTSSGT